jgi:hypothetical protein
MKASLFEGYTVICLGVVYGWTETTDKTTRNKKKLQN